MNFLFYLLLFSSVHSFGQRNDNNQNLSKDSIVAVFIVSPEFPGGSGAMVEFIQKNFKHPKILMENKIQGTIWVSCFIEKNGVISEIKIEKGLFDDYDKEAIRVIRLMPKWKPGEDQSGNIKRMKYHIPIKIK